MENTDSNFVYQWLWNNLRYHSRRYCEHNQSPGYSKEGCYHRKSEYAVIIDTKRKCEFTNSSNSKEKLHGKRGVTLHASQIHAFFFFFFYKKPVYKKPRTRYPQITPHLRNFKNYKKNGILT